MQKTLYIGLDIDGTVIEHCYPHMDGEDLGATPWLRRIVEECGPVVFLMNSMRSDRSADLAIAWLQERGIQLGGVNRHPDQGWTNSPKCHCHIYIEDRACGVPLRADMAIDWERYGPMVLETVRNWRRYYDRFGPDATGPRAPRTVIRPGGEPPAGS